MELNRVIVIEDRVEIGEQVSEEFNTNGVDVLPINGIDELEEHIYDLHNYQMIILDWLLEGDSSDSAKVCLARIRETCFIPVIVWSEQIDIFFGEEDDVYNIFPQAYIKGLSKSEVGYTNLLHELQVWNSQPPMNFTRQFRKSVHKAIESAYYNLADHSLDDLVKGLKSLIITGSNTAQVDIEHAIDVLIRLVGREVYKDDEFIHELRIIIENLQLLITTRISL